MHLTFQHNELQFKAVVPIYRPMRREIFHILSCYNYISVKDISGNILAIFAHLRLSGHGTIGNRHVRYPDIFSMFNLWIS